MKITPQEENLFQETKTKQTFYYYDENNKPIYKTKEIFKNKSLIVVYPYSVDRLTGEVSSKKIKKIQFKGWSKLEDLPKDFNKSKYGFSSKRIKYVMSQIYPKYKENGIDSITFGININTRFSPKNITINWADIEPILKKVEKEISHFNKNKLTAINHGLSGISSKFTKKPRFIVRDEMNTFLEKFDSFDKLSEKDADAIARVLDFMPEDKIAITSHFIKTKEKINIAYIDEIIKTFKKYLSEKQDNEEKWQKFFEDHSWILNHLFPYQAILSGTKAYVGGKTIENSEGRIVDFLFQSKIKDNYALLEIKTHRKKLVKNTIYRKPDVFPVTDELSGAVNQCLDQKDIFLRDLGQKYTSLDPKCILIVGNKKDLNQNQSKCFELYRSNQKNVEITTFDELLDKLIGLHKIITQK